MAKIPKSQVNDFAIRSFRNIADGDYITARLAFRYQLIPQFYWSSLQAIEKYLKCILVLNRIPAKRGHNLSSLLTAFKDAGKFEIRLTGESTEFIALLDEVGRHRYYESSYYSLGNEIVSLDRVTWEVRRYARILDYNIADVDGNPINLLAHELKANEKAEDLSPHRFRIIGGRLEAIIDKRDHPSREPLLWQNAFFGLKPRKIVMLPGRMEAGNAPLSIRPEILDEVKKYVFLPKDVSQAYQDLRQTKAVSRISR